MDQAPEYKESEYLDIYIDGARHLPDNSTVTQLQVKVVDVDLSLAQPISECTADIVDSTLRTQVYNFKYEVRPKKKLKPTSLLLVKIHTIDKSTVKHCVVGTVYFPLFIDKKSEEPPLTNNSKALRILVGNYQLPIYWGEVKE
mmetsp:Transcript_24184/g.37204  ORF Transcript_24184/g.37204 Transcript_24184/m.37204 type:complete len:143 (+) Transcript_24184:3606-4034(+)